MAKKKQLKITQFKSIIGQTQRQKQTIAALGLRRIRHSVVHNDTPAIRGMIDKVRHLVTVEEA
jgi:large subunit ribosomal protein L30